MNRNITMLEFLNVYRQTGEIPLTEKGWEKVLMTVDEFIEVYGDTEGLPHTKEEFDAWFKENAKTREEQERAWKEFCVTGQCHFQYPATEDECFKKEDNGKRTETGTADHPS